MELLHRSSVNITFCTQRHYADKQLFLFGANHLGQRNRRVLGIDWTVAKCRVITLVCVSCSIFHPLFKPKTGQNERVIRDKHQGSHDRSILKIFSFKAAMKSYTLSDVISVRALDASAWDPTFISVVHISEAINAGWLTGIFHGARRDDLHTYGADINSLNVIISVTFSYQIRANVHHGLVQDNKMMSAYRDGPPLRQTIVAASGHAAARGRPKPHVVSSTIGWLMWSCYWWGIDMI